jgi:hypothetical protein
MSKRFMSNGKLYVSKNEAAQRLPTAVETPALRRRFGKISEMTTQVTGARDTA